MPLPEFSISRLTTDRFVESKGMGRGAIGVVIEVFYTGYVVEFSRPDGTTIALFGAGFKDVEETLEVMGATSEQPSV